jgi:hypothetical protein
MREFDELRLAMIVLGSIHEQHGVTVSLRRGGSPPAGGRLRAASCGPAGWRAVGRRTSGTAAGAGSGTRPETWTAWATRPYEAACRLAELLDRAGDSAA